MVSLLVVAAIAIVIYVSAVSDTIELTMMPTSDIQGQLDVFVDAGLCWRAYVNEDETAEVIHLTKKQRERWIEWVKDSINQALERVNNSENIEYIVSEDYKVLTLRANENMSYKAAGSYVGILLFDMEIYQVLMGEENWLVYFELEDMDTGEILYIAVYYEEISIYFFKKMVCPKGETKYPISECVNLTSLFIGYAEFTDINAVSNLTNLHESVTLNCDALTDFST